MIRILTHINRYFIFILKTPLDLNLSLGCILSFVTYYNNTGGIQYEKYAFITVANKGIGYELVRQLAETDTTKIAKYEDEITSSTPITK